nr:hypothetical protein [Psychromicrobium sp. YIM S02556]
MERFWQTLKKWLTAQPAQPAALAVLQSLLDAFRVEYNTRPAPGPATPGHPGRGLHGRPQGRPGRKPGCGLP